MAPEDTSNPKLLVEELESHNFVEDVFISDDNIVVVPSGAGLWKPTLDTIDDHGYRLSYVYHGSVSDTNQGNVLQFAPRE